MTVIQPIIVGGNGGGESLQGTLSFSDELVFSDTWECETSATSGSLSRKANSSTKTYVGNNITIQGYNHTSSSSNVTRYHSSSAISHTYQASDIIDGILEILTFNGSGSGYIVINNVGLTMYPNGYGSQQTKYVTLAIKITNGVIVSAKIFEQSTQIPFDYETIDSTTGITQLVISQPSSAYYNSQNITMDMYIELYGTYLAFAVLNEQ